MANDVSQLQEINLILPEYFWYLFLIGVGYMGGCSYYHWKSTSQEWFEKTTFDKFIISTVMAGLIIGILRIIAGIISQLSQFDFTLEMANVIPILTVLLIFILIYERFSTRDMIEDIRRQVNYSISKGIKPEDLSSDDFPKLKKFLDQYTEEVEAAGIKPETGGEVKEKPIPEDVRKKIENLDNRVEEIERMRLKLSPEAYISKGSFAFSQKKYNEALRYYEKAIELKPDDGRLWGIKGGILFILIRYKEALEPLTKAIELLPDNSVLWIIKGGTLNSLGKRDEALRCYEKAIELKPDDPAAWSSKGNSLVEVGRHEEALEALEKSIELRPDNATTLSLKGVALSGLEKRDDALTVLEKAIELQPDSSDVWYNKSCAMILMNADKESIKESFAKAVELDRNHLKDWKIDPQFDSIKNEKWFIDFVDSLKSS